MTHIDHLRRMALMTNSHAVIIAVAALEKCHEALVESGQLEVKVPAELMEVFKEQDVV